MLKNESKAVLIMVPNSITRLSKYQEANFLMQKIPFGFRVVNVVFGLRILYIQYSSGECFCLSNILLAKLIDKSETSDSKEGVWHQQDFMAETLGSDHRVGSVTKSLGKE